MTDNIKLVNALGAAHSEIQRLRRKVRCLRAERDEARAEVERLKAARNAARQRDWVAHPEDGGAPHG